jgi:uncharacterized LabA/DUF88 family protein
MSANENGAVRISQSVAILVDGNNIERSIHSETNKPNTMLNFDTLVPRLLGNRGLNRLVYFREGKQISSKLKERLHANYHGSVRPCHKSADIPLSIKATQLANKVDTIIIMSGDSDYVELVIHLKSEGVRVEIAAVPSTTSKLLIEEADYFHEITKEDWFTLEPKEGRARSAAASVRNPRNRVNAVGAERQRLQQYGHEQPVSSASSTSLAARDSRLIPLRRLESCGHDRIRDTPHAGRREIPGAAPPCCERLLGHW